jgi:hypothetical protein
MNHRALDTLHGRGGGRRVADGAVLPGIDDVATVTAICPHGHRWIVRADALGTCMADGHPLRKAKAKDAGRPIITVAYVSPDQCPCSAEIPSTTRRSA